MKRVLALDQASKCGYCVLIDGKIETYGVIKGKGKDYHQKVRFLEDSIEALIDQYLIDVVVCEVPNMGRNQGTYGKLSGLYYTTIDLALRKGLSYFAYSPSSWRAVLEFKQGRGVKRDELKQMAIAYVNEHTELELNNKQDDEAEATCIGLAYLKQMEEK
jgi:Holliday junction resolvasome RuvABC endonuclease subunit